jgi:DNA-binding NtrC family response regulator
MEKMNHNQISVLLVENVEEDYVLLRDLLLSATPQRYKLKWVNSYEGAIENLCSESFDVALVDDPVGTRTRIDLLKEAKARGSKTRVISLNRHGDIPAVTDASESGGAYDASEDLLEQLVERSIWYAVERRRSEALLLKKQEELESRIEEKTIELAKARLTIEETVENMELFGRTLSHGLRNPAGDLKRLAKRLMEGCHDSLGENGKAYCELLMRTSEHIISMTEHMNAYIKTNEPPIRREPTLGKLKLN